MLNSRSHALLAAGLAVPAIVCAAYVAGCTEESLKDGGTYSLQIAGQPFTLQVACTDASRTKGLGGVTTIADNGGMIFIFPDGREERSFWMKDCLLDMDIVFLDARGFVTATYTMKQEPPRGESESDAAFDKRMPRYRSLMPAQFIIELRKGRAAELGIKTQQKIAIDVPVLRSAAK